jgi:hypothetical protein
MKKKIELDEETARMLDEVRGDMSCLRICGQAFEKVSRCHTSSYARPPDEP